MTPSAVDKKFYQDTAWNYIAFFIMALTGLILNFFIAWKTGVETLGIFNQIYAIYVILGQLAALGIHDSVQKYIAQHEGDTHDIKLIGQTAFWISLGTGLIVSTFLFALSTKIGLAIESEQVGKGIAIVAPATCLFAINKVLMGILNGARRIKAMAVNQSLRMIVILSCCSGLLIMEQPAYLLASGFLAAEIILTPILLYHTQAWGWPFGVVSAKEWLLNHFKFGIKALSGGFLSESYIRIDILMLAIFVSDRDVGIYSFAAMFVEGLFQVPVVIRTISNPILVRLLLDKDPSTIIGFVRKVLPISIATYIPIAVIILVGFPLLTNFYPMDLITETRELLFILLAGLFVYAAFIPFDLILLQSGMPGRQSILFSLNVFINILLNITLIPSFGILGAALATAISFTASALTLNVAVRTWLGLRKGLLFNP